jgi:Fic family protein
MARKPYIWQQAEWPEFGIDQAALAAPIALARQEQGKVLGLFRAIGLPGEADVVREIWTDEAMATAAIEGEKLDLEAVRSSVMRRLGVEDSIGGRVNRNVDGLLDVMQDATNSYQKKLDDDRLIRWQSALFPGGSSGIRRIVVGKYRYSHDPMQIVSGPVGHEKVHYEAPKSSDIAKEMRRFLKWLEDSRLRHKGIAAMDGIVRAAIAHLWFETIHPFEDGNGRVGRAIVDMTLAQDVDSSQRFYSISGQLMAERKAYYDSLGAAQRGTLDVTQWVSFFVTQFRLACVTSQQVISAAIDKNRFWATHAQHATNERQRKVLRRLLDAGNGGFQGGMSAEKYSNLTGASKATATRDLGDMQKGGLLVTTGQGRGTRYWVNVPGWSTSDTPTPGQSAPPVEKTKKGP